MGKATRMWTHPCAIGEDLQGCHLRKQKPFTNVSEGIAAVSLLCLLCMYEPQETLKAQPCHEEKTPAALITFHAGLCSNPPLCDLVKVAWLLAGLGDECRPCCFQTPPPPPLIEHTLPGHCSLWPLY